MKRQHHGSWEEQFQKAAGGFLNRPGVPATQCAAKECPALKSVDSALFTQVRAALREEIAD